MTFQAFINTPGYLPMDDETHVFDTAREAWAYLADMRERDEDDNDDAEYTSLIAEMRAEDKPGVMYGSRPEFYSKWDLSIAYTVEETS